MLHLLFNDQAEWYIVCDACYEDFYDMQWAGSTRGMPGWREWAKQDLELAKIANKPCEMCGPKGNGGWSVNGRWPAAERRDAR